MITKGKLIADPTIDLDGDSVVSFMRDGAGNALTSTAGALDVNIDNASIAVTATDLDIRDLAFATDKVDVSGSSNVAVVDGGGSLTVDAVDLDIRNLVFATDKVDASGSTVELGATTLAALETITVLQGTSPWVVSATDLDIRNLVAATDSISIGDGTDIMLVNADGSINVQGTFTIQGQYAEDSAHVSGNVGLYNLAVRSDAPAVATSADGDYASQTVDAYNRAWVNSGSNVGIANSAASVTTTSGLLVAASAGRRVLRIQNSGTKAIFIGASGVGAANGWEIPAGASDEMEVGPAIAVHAVAEAGTQDIRILQLS